MQRIRLTRIGKKKSPFYRVIVTPKESAVQGKFTEILGNYNPFTKKLSIDKDSILKWLNMGARPSNTVAKLLLAEGLKHKLIIYKQARKVTKKELEEQKVEHEAEKVKEAEEKESAKAEWEEKSAEIAEEHEESQKLAESVQEEAGETAPEANTEAVAEDGKAKE